MTGVRPFAFRGAVSAPVRWAWPRLWSGGAGLAVCPVGLASPSVRWVGRVRAGDPPVAAVVWSGGSVRWVGVAVRNGHLMHRHGPFCEWATAGAFGVRPLQGEGGYVCGCGCGCGCEWVGCRPSARPPPTSVAGPLTRPSDRGVPRRPVPLPHAHGPPTRSPPSTRSPSPHTRSPPPPLPTARLPSRPVLLAPCPGLGAGSTPQPVRRLRTRAFRPIRGSGGGAPGGMGRVGAEGARDVCRACAGAGLWAFRHGGGLALRRGEGPARRRTPALHGPHPHGPRATPVYTGPPTR